MVDKMSRQYAFIIEHSQFPNPFLLEISRWTNLTRSTLSFFEPKVLYCPPAMVPIFRGILEKHQLRHYREAVKVEMVVALLDNLEFNHYYENTIMAIVRLECVCFLHVNRLTRSSHKMIYDLTKRVFLIRKNCFAEEHYLINDFTEDVRRSLGKLMHVLNNSIELK